MLRILMKAMLILFVMRMASGAASAQSAVDMTQAQAMLNLLERCHAGQAPPEVIDKVVALPGTQLIIEQQNISRRITSAQYKAVLASACKGEIAHVQPVDPGSRGEKGVQGLTEDVAPSLLWGRDHVDLLEQRLALAKEDRNFSEIVPLALENLPEKVPLFPKLYFVMGGRAGAAALDQGIYIDLLSFTWRSKENGRPTSSQDIVKFFAHETHHVGYGEILDQRKQRLHLVGGENEAWSFLTAIMMEGSATLLINAHGSWANLEKQADIQADIKRLPQLLPETQTILQRIANGKMNDQEYQAAVSNFLGEGYHATGARLLYVIQEVQGKPGVLRVMNNPRTLLTVYNECAAKRNEPFRFTPQLAKEIEKMGTSSK